MSVRKNIVWVFGPLSTRCLHLSFVERKIANGESLWAQDGCRINQPPHMSKSKNNSILK